MAFVNFFFFSLFCLGFWNRSSWMKLRNRDASSWSSADQECSILCFDLLQKSVGN